MSGKGQASGSDYESDAFAYIAAHVLAHEPLPWFQDPGDVPVSIRTQSGDPGDDFRVKLRDGRFIEVQAKRGASGNKDFIEAAGRLFAGLQRDPTLRGVLLADTSSTDTVRGEFEEDVRRLADGIEVPRRGVMKKVRDALDKRGIAFDPLVLRRFRLVVLDLKPGTDSAANAQRLLGSVLVDSARRYDAWNRLGREQSRVATRAGEQNRVALVELLKPHIVKDVSDEHDALETYIDWAIETNAQFVVAALPDVRIDSFEAWDELTPPAHVETFIEDDAEAIRRYHAWEAHRDHVSVTESHDARKLLEAGASAIVIGGAGSGKSTLTRRLVREACEGGIVAMRISLRQVGLTLAAGKTIDDALVEAAFQGSGIPDAVAERLLARAAFLIADGLDESDRVKLAEHLVTWMKGHPGVALIVTTRPVGHSAALLPGIPSVELMALHPGGTRQVARAIIHAAIRDFERAEETLEAFEEQLETNPAATLAARNPFLLSCLVALALEGRPLPKHRALLIGEVLDLLYRTQPHERTASVPLLNELVAERVANVAGWLLSESPALTRSDLVKVMGEWLERDGFGNRFDSHQKADEALTFWEERRLFERLRSGSREYLTFVHLQLGEYAAARLVAEMSAEKRAEWLKRVRRLPRWRQVILFVAQSGDVESIVSILLDLDDPNDPESDEAFLAAACLEEVDTPPEIMLVERVIDRLALRLGGARELEAADALVHLAPFAPERISRQALPLLDHSSPETQLAAEAMVLAGDPAQIPPELPRKWIEGYLPIQPIIMGNLPPELISPLPEEARALQQRTASLAIDALFRIEPREEALAVARTFVTSLAYTSLLLALEAPLARHDAIEVIEPVLEKWRQTMLSTVPKFDTPQRRDEFLALLDAIAACVGSPDENADDSRHNLPLVSRVLGALGYWELDFEELHQREYQESLDVVVDRVLRGMRVDRQALRRELASAYRLVNALTPRGIFAHVRAVAVAVDWTTAAAEPIAPDLLRRALTHPARAVALAAAELMIAGAAGDHAREVIAEALAEERHYACIDLVRIAPDVIGTLEAAAVIRERLHNGDDRPWRLNGIFRGIAFAPVELRRELKDEIVSAISGPNSFVATAAVEALAKLEHDCTREFVSAVRAAHEFWSARPLLCERCDLEVSERFCPKCRFGVSSPREGLLRELARCGAATEEELRPGRSHGNVRMLARRQGTGQ